MASTSTATVVTVFLLMTIATFLFPPVIVYLMTNGHWPSPYLLGPQSANSTWVDLLASIPPVALLIAPDAIRKALSWDEATENTRNLLPSWLAGIALLFTSGYALALHFVSARPLAQVPLNDLVLAVLFVGVVLWPLYKRIASSCWRLGIAEAVKAEDWRNGQRQMFKELRDKVREAWRKPIAIEESPTMAELPAQTERQSASGGARAPSSSPLNSPR